MFSEDSFATLTFADLTVVLGFVYYSPTKMRTRVTLVSPSGKIITSVPGTILRTKTEILSPVGGKIITAMPGIKLRTDVKIYSPASGHIIVSSPAYKINTKVEISSNDDIGKVVVESSSHKLKTKVTVLGDDVITYTEPKEKVYTDVEVGMGATSIGLRLKVL